MEAAYRQNASGKHYAKSDTNRKNTEKRRLVQLVLSLLLFFVAFLGRNAFPNLGDNLKNLISNDIPLGDVIHQLNSDIAEGEGLVLSLKHLGILSVGGEITEPEQSFLPEGQIQNLVEIMPLSEMGQHGLSYYRENGLRKYPSETIDADRPNETAQPEPDIVTAVAQPYNESGEALPRNVSYQYYELGLEKTVVPVMGTVTSGFEYRTSPISGQKEFHLALDIAAPKGTEIAAFADGVVRYIGESDDFGLYLMIDHDNGVASFYAHCSKLLVQKGDIVDCGETVALVGDTGNATGHHLHFTIEKDNIRLDPAHYVDPEV